MGVDWKKEIADYATYLKGKGEVTPVLPEAAAPVKEKNVKVKNWPFDANAIKAMLANEKETRKGVILVPESNLPSFVFLPGEFAMGSLERICRPIVRYLK